MDLDDKICNQCINKHITDENRLFCWKGIDTSNIVSVCTNYSTIVIDDVFILKNKTESYSENKIKLFFLICFILPVVVLIFICLFIIDLNFISFLVVFVIAGFEFFPIISLYKGKKWAKILFNVIISFNVFGAAYTLGKFETSSDALISIFSSIFSMYILYFINFDKEFKLFFKSKTND